MKIKEILNKLLAKFKRQEKTKLRNKSALKHGSYAIAITAIVIAVAVALNVLLAVLSRRVNLEIDLSTSKDSTLSQENVEFLNGIDTDIKITVCADKEDYVSGYLDYYVAQSEFGASDSTGQYYSQTIKLLEKYEVANNHITVSFVNPQSAEFNPIISEYSKSNLGYGDLIVEANHMVDGKETKRSSIVKFEDIYRITESEYAMYGGYNTVSGNFLETALTSAIYKVVSTETKNAVIVGTHCRSSATEYFAAVLELNNFDVSYITDLVIGNISEEADLLIIAMPHEDFTASELEIIEKWLINDEKRGRGLMYFASTVSPSLPNLHAYLEEWGIAFGDGVIYETDESSCLPSDPMTMGFTAAAEEKSDNPDTYEFQKEATSEINLILSGSNVPMYTTFDTLDTRVTAKVATTMGETAVIAPKGSSTEWKPDASYEKEMRNGIIITRDYQYIDNVAHNSYVAAFSSTDYISSDWVAYSDLDNMDSALKVAKIACEAEESSISFATKTISSESYADKVTETSANAVRTIFQYVIPALLILCGIFVFVRRARR